MSTSPSQIPLKNAANATSKDLHKTKKRKHVDDHGESRPEKKKKHKKAEVTNDDNLPTPETPGKQSRKRRRTPLALTGPLTPTSPSQTGDPNSTSIFEDEAPETLRADKTAPQPSPPRSLLDSTAPSTFHSVRLSLYLPVSAISLSPSTTLASVQAEHLSPLLLTYYAPARGVVLAFTDTVLSSTRPDPSSSSSSSPPTHILAHCADDYGVSYTWLTTTFLVFRPTPGDTLSGWINVCSDSFIGLVVYNYFQAGVVRPRIPQDWRWVRPGGAGAGESRKRSKRKTIKMRSSPDFEDGTMDLDTDTDTNNKTQTATKKDPAAEEDNNDYDDGTGHFVRADGSRVTGTLQFRIVDAEVVPGHDREKWSLQIEGTLLSAEDEVMLVEEERVQAEKLKARGKSSIRGAGTPGRDTALMSGGLGVKDRRRTVSASQTPVPSSTRR